MRQTAARLNRTWLTILGVLLVLAGAAGVLLATGLAGPLLQRAGAGVPAPDTGRQLFGSAVTAAFGLTWIVVVTAVVGLVVGLLGLAWLVAQVPRKHEAKPFRLHDDARTGLTRLEPGVLTAAVEAQTEAVPGVDSASAVLRGTVDRPELTLRVCVDDRTSIPQVLEQVHREVAGALAGSLDTRLRRLAVEVGVSRSGSRSSRGQVQVAASPR